MQMKKLLLSTAMALLATGLCATSAFAVVPCNTNGANGLAVIPQVVAVGSSAQFNTFAYAAAELLTAQAGDTGINTGDFNLFTVTAGATVNDNRFSQTLGDGANPVSFIWDNNTTCNLYAYFTTDSGIGVKDFFATVKLTPANQTGTPKVYSVAGATVSLGTLASANAVPGLPDNAASLPSAIKNYFNTPWVPVYSATTHLLTNAPLPYCGSTAAAPTANGWCVFNVGATDIRPEDALYAATRALSTLNTGSYAGLGYNNATCDAGQGGNSAAQQGCPIFDTFGQKKVFNVLSFKLSGTDPVTAASLPPYTTISTGAAPILVIVTDADSAGFGTGAPSNYAITNVNRGVLSQIFQGNLHCTGDLLPGFSSSGQPIQEIQREPLSGTYNTFEFTAVRTLSGSSNGATSAKSATAWPSNDNRSTENNINPTTGFGDNACGFASYVFPGNLGTNKPDGTETCGDPVFAFTGNVGKACGQGIRARAIGTGEEVKATMALQGTAGGVTITDGIGYAFWSYGNLAPTATSCGTSTNQNTYNSACTFLGHYLTVDGVDPLFTTAGGGLDTVKNPAGNFQAPQCNFNALPCFTIPFTHVKDGTYPLWSLLRDVTIGTSTTAKTVTPPAVVSLIAYAEFEASQNDRLSDFVPFLSVTNPAAADPTGNLNLGVFREHFHQTNNPVNGYAKCNNTFTGVFVNPSDPSNTNPGCLLDAGGDMGGTVLTVQSDIDFNADFGTLFNSPNYEIYSQHQ